MFANSISDTSRCSQLKDLDNIKTFGFRGEALSSIGSSSLLTITSRHRDYKSTDTVRVHYSQRIASHPAFEKMTNSGTVVTVNNLYSNIPVRYKHIQSIPVQNQIRDVKLVLEYLAMTARSIGISMYDENTGSRILSISSLGENSTMTREVQVLRAVHDETFISCWKEVSATSLPFSVTGIISTVAKHGNYAQFITLNRRKLQVPELQSSISKLFRQSGFGAGEKRIPRKRKLTIDEAKLYPVYVFKVTGPVSGYDLIQEPSKSIVKAESIGIISKMILEVVNSFLISQGYSGAGSKKEGPKRNNEPAGVNTDGANKLVLSKVRSSKDDPKEVQGRLVMPITKKSLEKKLDEAFKILEPRTSSISNNAPVECCIPQLRNKATNIDLKHQSPFFTGFSRTEELKLLKGTLSSCEVVAQVDNKFVMAKIKIDSYQSPVLMLIDQHAADERIRVEMLIADFFNQCSVKPPELLPQSCEISLSDSEADLFQSYKESVHQWGIKYKWVGANAIQVTHVPSVIWKYCTAKNDFLKGMIVGYIYDLEEGRAAKLNLSVQEAEWPLMIRACPSKLIDVLNMTACRGAIKFGDKLTIDECHNLVAKLSRCKFPFQCAHGRPAVFPLARL